MVSPYDFSTMAASGQPKFLQVGCQGPKGAYLSVYLEIERESEKERLREKENFASGSTQPKTKS